MSQSKSSNFMGYVRMALMMPPKMARNSRALAERATVAPAKQNGLQGRINHFFFRAGTREGLYEFLAVQIRNNQSDIAALERYRSRLIATRKKTQASILSDMIRRIKSGGGSWSNAFAPWVPNEEVRIIHGGEMSGAMAEAFETIITLNERRADIAGKVRKAVITPLLYILVIYAFLLFIGIDVTPAFSKFLPNPTGMGAILYAEADFVDSWEAFIPPVFLVLSIGLFTWSLSRWTGKWRAILDRYMPYAFYKNIRGYIWVLTFTAMLQSNLSDTEIIKRQMQRCDPWLKERLRILNVKLGSRGESLPIALRSASIGGIPMMFPNEALIDAIDSVYGNTDSNKRMQIVIERWSGRFDKLTNKQITNFSVYAQLTVFGILAFMLIALNDMSGQLATVTTFK